MSNTIQVPGRAEDVSDGYHTFGELYAHRHALFANLCMLHRQQAFKTRLNDKGEAWEGWFILGLNTEYGQISYHLPDRWWDHIDVPEVERNTDYDGHTSSDVLIRLMRMAGYDFLAGAVTDL